MALQRMVKKLDAGDVIGIRKVAVPLELTAMELHDQLALLGADLLRVELMDYVRGNLAPVKQEEALVTVAKKIDKLESEIKWNLQAIEIHNQVRALTMGPGSYTLFNGKKLKIHKTAVPLEFANFEFKIQTQQDLKNYIEDYQKRKNEKSEKAGTVIQVTEDFIRVQAGSGYVDLLEVQPESRNRMKIKDFLQGNEVRQGTKFS